MKHVLAILAALLSLGVTAAHAEDPHSHHAQVPAGDSRVMLELDPGERAMILEEMRQFLAGVQKMTSALARQDMQEAAGAARGMGQKVVHEVPPALRATPTSSAKSSTSCWRVPPTHRWSSFPSGWPG